VAGESVRTLLASNTSTVAKAFGIGELTEETAANSSVGFTFNIGELSATVDAYSIAVKDRIVLTDNFDASALNVGAEDAQFFANGVDTKTTGVDIVLNYSKSVGNGNRLSVGLAGNMNTLEIEKINNGALNEFTFFGPFSQAYLEAAAPDYKFGLNLGFQTKKLNLAATFTSFSEVILQDFQWIDSPATTQAEADALFAVATDTYEAATTLDLSAGYSISNNLVLTVGANNLLNTYPTPQYDGWTDQGGFNDSIQMGSDGAYYFSSIGYKF
jgi:iron complex outermembrane receptor protein